MNNKVVVVRPRRPIPSLHREHAYRRSPIDRRSRRTPPRRCCRSVASVTRLVRPQRRPLRIVRREHRRSEGPARGVMDSHDGGSRFGVDQLGRLVRRPEHRHRPVRQAESASRERSDHQRLGLMSMEVAVTIASQTEDTIVFTFAFVGEKKGGRWRPGVPIGHAIVPRRVRRQVGR